MLMQFQRFGTSGYAGDFHCQYSIPSTNLLKECNLGLHSVVCVTLLLFTLHGTCCDVIHCPTNFFLSFSLPELNRCVTAFMNVVLMQIHLFPVPATNHVWWYTISYVWLYQYTAERYQYQKLLYLVLIRSSTECCTFSVKLLYEQILLPIFSTIFLFTYCFDMFWPWNLVILRKLQACSAYTAHMATCT